MSFLERVVQVPRRTMVLFFLVDTSGSMMGDKIGAVNSAIEEVIPELRDISESNADACIKIAALKFSTEAEWCYDAPVEAGDFRWNYLNAGGVTAFGRACEALNEKLSSREFMSDVTGAFAPAILLMTDGEPTDNWKEGLGRLRQNSWFKHAIKVGIAIGDDANKAIIAEFTGTPEAVLEVHQREALKKMIKFVSVRASQLASQGAAVGSEPGAGAASGKQVKLIKDLADMQSADPDPGGWGDDQF
jgi:uncharacterized protein YegL